MTWRTAVAARARPLRCVWFVVVWLAGCQTAPVPVAPSVAPEQVVAGWPARRAQLQARAQYTAQGRIGVVSGSTGFNGHLRWVQDGARTTVNLDGPLGVGGVRIQSDGTVLTFTDASGAVLDSQAAHDELVRQMGFEPPLNSLRYWIQGVPDPATPGVEMPDAQGYLGSLSQSDWTITYSAYMQTPGGALPQKLSLVRGAVHVKLSLDSWQSP